MRTTSRGASLRSFLAVVALTGVSALAVAQEAAAPADITLPTKRVGLLPAEITNVTIGPDDRLWFQTGYNNRSQTLDQVRGNIVRQFKDPTPQLNNSSPLLFEPTGRIWFSAYASDSDGPMILGYDGTKFVERSLGNNGGYPVSALPGRGGLALEGQVAFTARSSVYLYDGKSWSSRDLSDGNGYDNGVQLAAEPDRKGFLAVVRGNGATVWRCRDGKWTRLFAGATDSGNSLIFANVVAGEKGFWSITNYGAGSREATVQFLSYAGQTASLSTDKLLEQLKAEKFEDREAATQALVARGSSIANRIQSAIDEHTRDEMKYRLEYIKIQINNGGYSRPWNVYTALGDYNVRNAIALVDAGQGRMVLVARDVRDRKPTTTKPATPTGGGPVTADDSRYSPGFLYMDAAGTWSRLETDEPIRSMRSPLHSYSSGGLSTLLPGVDANHAWLLLENNPVPFAINLADKKATLRPAAIYTYATPRAITKGGKFFLQASSGGRVVVDDPALPDDRQPLAITQTMAQPYMQFLAPDGSLFVRSNTEGLKRFDGTAWQDLLANDRLPNLRQIMPGSNGTCIAQLERHWMLIGKDLNQEADSLEDLISQNTAAVAKAFSDPPRNRGPYYSEAWQIQADAKGRIYLLRGQSRELKVYIKDRWIDAADALRAGGFKRGQANAICRVGDGSRILASDSNESNAALLSVSGTDELTANAAGENLRVQSTNVFHVTREGEVFLPATMQTPERGYQSGTVSIGDEGVLDQIPDAFPLALEPDGTLWLRASVMSGSGRQSLKAFYKGKLSALADLQLPQESNFIVSPAAGVLYTWSELGFRQIKREKADDRTSYKVAGTYAPQNLDHRIGAYFLSPLGFFAALSTQDNGPQVMNIYALPK